MFFFFNNDLNKLQVQHYGRTNAWCSNQWWCPKNNWDHTSSNT